MTDCDAAFVDREVEAVAAAGVGAGAGADTQKIPPIGGYDSNYPVRAVFGSSLSNTKSKVSIRSIFDANKSKSRR